MSEKSGHYLEYLDKEMGIMGVLSTFCLAVPSLFFERVATADPKAMGHDFLASLWSSGLWFLIWGSALMFGSAACFYRQRSRLAWYYGQIALELSLPGYTGRTVDEWLKKADSWDSWIPYQCGFWMCVSAVCEWGLAMLSVYVCEVEQWGSIAALVVVALLCGWLVLIRRNSIKFKDRERLPYFES
ncbi:MAG: hypothetical protein ABSG14_08545 [Verrucomicrobiia bacterium]|jgi:hypothetical protein